ncbi:unnamed protein product, partial [Phaeothamnion confervicola]
ATRAADGRSTASEAAERAGTLYHNWLRSAFSAPPHGRSSIGTGAEAVLLRSLSGSDRPLTAPAACLPSQKAALPGGGGSGGQKRQSDLPSPALVAGAGGTFTLRASTDAANIAHGLAGVRQKMRMPVTSLWEPGAGGGANGSNSRVKAQPLGPPSPGAVTVGSATAGAPLTAASASMTAGTRARTSQSGAQPPTLPVRASFYTAVALAASSGCGGGDDGGCGVADSRPGTTQHGARTAVSRCGGVSVVSPLRSSHRLGPVGELGSCLDPKGENRWQPVISECLARTRRKAGVAPPARVLVSGGAMDSGGGGDTGNGNGGKQAGKRKSSIQSSRGEGSGGGAGDTSEGSRGSRSSAVAAPAAEETAATTGVLPWRLEPSTCAARDLGKARRKAMALAEGQTVVVVEPPLNYRVVFGGRASPPLAGAAAAADRAAMPPMAEPAGPPNPPAAAPMTEVAVTAVTASTPVPAAAPVPAIP